MYPSVNCLLSRAYAWIRQILPAQEETLAHGVADKRSRVALEDVGIHTVYLLQDYAICCFARYDVLQFSVTVLYFLQLLRRTVAEDCEAERVLVLVGIWFWLILLSA